MHAIVLFLLPKIKAAHNRTGAAAPAAAAEAPVEEQTDFDVKLDSFEAAAKIKVIKEIRSLSDLGLKEAKELVGSLATCLSFRIPFWNFCKARMHNARKFVLLCSAMHHLSPTSKSNPKRLCHMHVWLHMLLWVESFLVFCR